MITQSYKLLAISPAHFSDYVAAEAAIEAKVASMSQAELTAMEAAEEQEQSYILQMVDNVAVIDIKGRLTNNNCWVNRYFGFLAYDEIRKAVLQAREMEAEAIVFPVSSAGGSVEGMADTAELISTIGIPTISFTASAMMSAAYFLGIQADYVYADTFADVGSVGVIVKFYDRSKMLADAGIRPERFRSGNLKAAGDGDFKLSAEERKYITDKVQNYADKFYGIVSDARGMSVESMEKLGITSGRTYIGEQALAVNLVDDIKSFDQSMLKAYEVAKKVDKRDNYSLF